jgi:hypothetical protein
MQQSQLNPEIEAEAEGVEETDALGEREPEVEPVLSAREGDGDEETERVRPGLALADEDGDGERVAREALADCEPVSVVETDDDAEEEASLDCVREAAAEADGTRDADDTAVSVGESEVV